MKRLIYIAYFLEVGFLLIVVPWSAFWERNYFADLYPALRAFLDNNFVRGGVSGVGIVNLCVGIVELGGFVSWRRLHETVDVRRSAWSG